MHDPSHLTLSSTLPVFISTACSKQCCWCCCLLAEFGYFEIAHRGSKNCCEGGLQLGWFPSVCLHHLFLLQICQVSVNSGGYFEPSKYISHSFYQSGFKISWRAISIDYSLHAKVKNLIIFFLLIGWFWLFQGWKVPKFGKLGAFSLDKNWATLKSLVAGKRANLLRFGALKFGNTAGKSFF